MNGEVGDAVQLEGRRRRPGVPPPPPQPLR